MKLISILSFMACVAVGSTYDVSHFRDGTYTARVDFNGSIDWENAILSNETFKSFHHYHYPSGFARYSPSRIWNIATDSDNSDGKEGKSEEPGIGNGGGIDTIPDRQSQISDGHCHNHWPHHGNLFLPGQIEYNKTSEPPCLALFMTWMSQGVEGGFINPGEVRFSKYNDLIIGACVFSKLNRKRTCVHELSLAMNGADSECAGGRMGCHVCVGHWDKDYFRFSVKEAPTQCRCAWHF